MKKISVIVPLLLAVVCSASAAGQLTIEEFIARTGVSEGPTAVREHPGWRPTPTILMSDYGEISDGLTAKFPGATIITVSSAAEAMEHASAANVILGFCRPDIVQAAGDLVWVQTYLAGVERCLDVPKIGSGQVLLTNMQKMSSPTIGEHAIAMMFSLMRGLTQFAKAMPEGEWNRRHAGDSGIHSIHGKTLLVAGLGGIGREVAWRAHALGMRVVATRNSSREGPDYVDYVGLSDELLELAANADVIVNALPLTDATTGLFDGDFFAAAKQGAYFINVGRGGTVVTDDLDAALEAGHIAGAGLDVMDPEPLPPQHPLWQRPSVIITPHIAWVGSDRRWEGMLILENLRRYLAGDALLNEVDPQKGY